MTTITAKEAAIMLPLDRYVRAIEKYKNKADELLKLVTPLMLELIEVNNLLKDNKELLKNVKSLHRNKK